MKSKGLGTGLGALFGNAALEEAAGDFEYVSIQRVEPRLGQPRSVFEQEKIDELADSIREHGILSPLTVRRLDGGYFQIVAGERRWRAARESGLTEVPVRIIVADDRRATELALVENLQREDLSPIDEARGYMDLMEGFGLTQEDVAQRVSKSRPAVANALRLLSLPAELVELVGNGSLSAGSARAILALKDSESMLKAAQNAIANDMSVREVESLVRRLLRDESEREKRPRLQVDYLKEAQNTLTASLGRRVTIKQGKDKGKIEIEFYGSDDFDALFDELSSKR